MKPMSMAPNWEEAMRAANAFGHNAFISEGQWLGDPNMNQLGLGDSCYGMPGLGDGAQEATQIISALTTPFIQLQQQKLALKQQEMAARQARMQGGGAGGSITQGGGSGDMSKTLLMVGVAIVVVILIMSLMKKKSSGGEAKHEEPKGV